MQNQKGNTSVVISFIFVVLVVGLVVFVLMNRNNQPIEDISGNNISENQTEDNLNQNEKGEIAEENQMEQVSKSGLPAKAGDVLVMNYTGRLTNGTVFDSNVDQKFGHVEPFEFTLGAGQVIKGWDEGLVGMKVGEKKTLTISPENAYGNRANGSIPANSTLIFDVELVEIK